MTTRLGIIKTRRPNNAGIDSIFAHWFNPGTLVYLDKNSGLYDYYARTVNPVFGHKLIAERRSQSFTPIAQYIDSTDVLVLPRALERPALALAKAFLRVRYFVGK